MYTQEDPIGLHGGLNVYGYATANPVIQGDPLGLVTWSCTYGTLTPSTPLIGVAGVFAGFTCKSDCACGRSVFTQVLAFGFGVSGAHLPIGLSFSSIKLEDSLPCPSATALQGGFRIGSFGGYALFGGGCSDITLGSAKGKGCGRGWGLDFGGTIAGGSSITVLDTSLNCCKQ